MGFLQIYKPALKSALGLLLGIAMLCPWIFSNVYLFILIFFQTTVIHMHNFIHLSINSLITASVWGLANMQKHWPSHSSLSKVKCFITYFPRLIRSSECTLNVICPKEHLPVSNSLISYAPCLHDWRSHLPTHL